METHPNNPTPGWARPSSCVTDPSEPIRIHITGRGPVDIGRCQPTRED